MRILITNDDGIESPALPRLVRWARRLGEVTVVAPKTEQSGKSQAIEFCRPMEVREVAIAPDVTVYSADSTPADCVRFAVLGLKKSYDLVISGINRGYNLGHDIVYSGTVGAIYEGARLGMRGVALSTDPDTFEDAFQALDIIHDYFKSHDLLTVGRLYNVNIPKAPQNIVITAQGGPFFCDTFAHVGGDFYVQEGEPVTTAEGDLSTDISAVLHNHISITPLAPTRTDIAVLQHLRGV